MIPQGVRMAYPRAQFWFDADDEEPALHEQVGWDTLYRPRPRRAQWRQHSEPRRS